MKSALITGSFDPVTVGHLDIIKRASAVFDKVYVVIFNNTEKKYMFSLEDRKAMLDAAVSDIQNAVTDVSDGLVTEYVRSNGISAIVRGIRDSSDTAYEISLSAINFTTGDGIDTVLFPAKPEFSYISSTFARDMFKYGKSLAGIVPEKSLEAIKYCL